MDIKIGGKIFNNIETDEMALDIGASPEDIINAKKSELVIDVKSIADKIREIATGGASALKINGWIAKTPSARRIAKGGTDIGDIAILTSEAVIKGVTPLEQAQKITAKAEHLATLNGVVEAFEDKLIDVIEAGHGEAVTGLLDDAKKTLKTQTSQSIGVWITEASNVVKEIVY